MITRVWRGWAAPENAESYQALLLGEVVPGIEGRRIPGYRGMSVARRDRGSEIEFLTIMWFESLADIEAFAGENYEVAVVPVQARELLLRFDAKSEHFETLVMSPSCAAGERREL